MIRHLIQRFSLYVLSALLVLGALSGLPSVALANPLQVSPAAMAGARIAEPVSPALFVAQVVAAPDATAETAKTATQVEKAKEKLKEEKKLAEKAAKAEQKRLKKEKKAEEKRLKKAKEAEEEAKEAEEEKAKEAAKAEAEKLKSAQKLEEKTTKEAEQAKVVEAAKVESDTAATGTTPQP